MNIEEVDKWLKDQYGISYTEMSNEFNGASELLSKKYKEIERRDNIINRTTKYVQGLSSKGRGCDIYEDIKQEILKELKGNGSNE